jgi:hypothetical protein
VADRGMAFVRCSRCWRTAGKSQETCELGDADAPLPEGEELRARAGQAVDADELGSTEALHVDAVAEKSAPVQVFVRVRDED